MLIHSGAFTMGGEWYKVLKPYYIAYRKNVIKYSIDLTATKRPEGPTAQRSKKYRKDLVTALYVGKISADA